MRRALSDMGRGLDWLKPHWKELSGVPLGLALLLFLFKTSNFGEVVGGFEHFRYALLPIVFGLVLAREAVRVVEWHILLRRLGIVARWSHSTIALLGGDASQIIPAGIYVSNWFLKREEDASVARSLSATVAVQYLEVIVSLLLLALLRVPNWPWLRPAAAVVLGGFLGFFFSITRPGTTEWLDQHANRGKLWGKLVDGIKQMLEGIEGLLDWRTVLSAGALAAVHLALTVGCLYVIMVGLTIKAGWLQAAVTYAFVLAVVNLNPLPTDIGVSEGSGMSIFAASGIHPAQGLTAMLLVRFAIIMSTALLLGIAAAVLPRATKHLVQGPSREDAVANAKADPNQDDAAVAAELDEDERRQVDQVKKLETA